VFQLLYLFLHSICLYCYRSLICTWVTCFVSGNQELDLRNMMGRAAGFLSGWCQLLNAQFYKDIGASIFSQFLFLYRSIYSQKSVIRSVAYNKTFVMLRVLKRTMNIRMLYIVNLFRNSKSLSINLFIITRDLKVLF
jgi:hypothetical protein